MKKKGIMILLALLCSGAASHWANAQKEEMKKVERRTYKRDQGKEGVMKEVRKGDTESVKEKELKTDEKKLEKKSWLEKINALLLTIEPAQVGDSCDKNNPCPADTDMCCNIGKESSSGVCMPCDPKQTSTPMNK